MTTRILSLCLSGATILLCISVFFFRAPRLTLETQARGASIGIPGITKMYGAVVRNAGIRPVKVTVCDAVTDAMQREIGVRHAIERRNESTGQWSVFWQIPRAEWCRPYPTGIVKGEISEAWLWPGQVLQTGEIAIQASDGLALNDRLRFVVYPYDTAGQAVLGEAFVVDERPTR